MQLEIALRSRAPLALTWWGCATVAIESADSAVAIDPFVHPTEPRFEYLFCTHEHYDHLHLPTVERICAGGRFRRAIVARSCTLPSTLSYARQITFLPPDRLTVLSPAIYDHAVVKAVPEPTALDLPGWRVEGVHSPGEEASVAGPVDGPVLQVGYLLRAEATGVSFLHPGDLCRPYPELAGLRGRVDILFLPLGKLDIPGNAALLTLVRPRYVVPIHYRYAGDYPIPKRYREDEPLERQILGYQFPGPADPDAAIAGVRELAAPLGVELLVLRAGTRYEL